MEPRHEHGGHSSRLVIRADRVLRECGIRPGQTFLDAGCGRGHVALAAARAVGPAGRVIAMDVHPASLAALRKSAARRAVANLTVIEADLTRPLPVADGSVDILLLLNVLHGFAANGETDLVLPGLARAVRPGGILAVGEFDKRPTLFGPPLAIRLAPAEVTDLVTPHGFTGPVVGRIGRWHYLARFTRTAST